MDLNVHEEDIVDQKIPFGFEQSAYSDEDRAKMKEAFNGDGTPEGEQATPEAEKKVEAQPEQTPAPVESKKYKVALPDGEVEVPEDELIKGYMRQADATKKWQEASRMRQEAEAIRQNFLTEWDKPEEPTFIPKPQATGEFQATTPAEELLYKEVQGLKGTVDKLAREREIDTRKQVYAQIDSAVSGFKAEHPDMDDEKVAHVLKICNDEGTRPSKTAFNRIYKAEFFDESRIREDERRKYADELKKKQPAALAPSNQSGVVEPEKPDVRNMTDEQRYAAMVKDLGF